MSIVGEKTQVENGEVRLTLKLFDTCLMSALLYEMETWKNCLKQKIKVKP